MKRVLITALAQGPAAPELQARLEAQELPR